jgi:hypothetical protein
MQCLQKLPQRVRRRRVAQAALQTRIGGQHRQVLITIPAAGRQPHQRLDRLGLGGAALALVDADVGRDQRRQAERAPR